MVGPVDHGLEILLVEIVFLLVIRCLLAAFVLPDHFLEALVLLRVGLDVLLQLPEELHQRRELRRGVQVNDL